MGLHIESFHQHDCFDNSLKPVGTAKSGDEVSFACLDASGGKITRDSTVDVLLGKMSSNVIHGPIYIEDCQPGDTLEVEFLELKPADWAWSGIIPGFGLLKDEFKPKIKQWKLDLENNVTWFNDKIKIPLDPFCGEVGVARAEPGAHSTIPPYRTGGNIDTKHLTKGSSLFLPVEVPGALLSIGDGHAGQGDGEICGVALETCMDVKIRVHVHKDKPYVKTPHILSKNPTYATCSQTGGFYSTAGVQPDLLEAAKEAVRSMIDWLGAVHHLEPADAYILCSIVVDLKITGGTSRASHITQSL